MKRKRIAVNARQRQTIQFLRRRFTEDGYFILSLSRRFRRSGMDTIAVSKIATNRFIIIRPSTDGTVSIRPYAGTVHGYPGKQLNECRKKVPAPLRWRRKSLHFGQRGKWTQLVTKNDRALLSQCIT